VAIQIQAEFFYVFVALYSLLFVLGLRYPIVGLLGGAMWMVFWLFFVSNGDSIVRYIGSTPTLETIFSWSQVSGINESVFYGMLFFFLPIAQWGISLGMARQVR